MLSKQLEYYLNKAIRSANERKHEFLTLENVLLSMIDDEIINKVLLECNANVDELKTDLSSFLDNAENFSVLSDEEIDELSKQQFANDEVREIARSEGIHYQPEISMSLQRVIQRAVLHAQQSGKNAVQPINLLVHFYSAKESHAAYYLKKQGIERVDIVSKIAHGVDSPVTHHSGQNPDQVDPLEADAAKTKQSFLEEFTINLKELAQEGKLDPIVGREEELNRVIQILCRRRKNNPILVGDAGVGKTAVAEGLALLIVAGKVLVLFKDMEIYSLGYGIFAGRD
jgi:ATP-dependent Clp protease ATP-binding subunit ClpA